VRESRQSRARSRQSRARDSGAEGTRRKLTRDSTRRAEREARVLLRAAHAAV